jgi:hypothetical protein
MNISFDYNEMKNFISHTGKYKIVNIKTYILVPGNWYERYREEEVDMEVAYLIDDIESEKWIFEERYRRRKDDYHMFTIESTFYREYKSKILNLLYK